VALLLPIAFLAGIVTAISPCVLPVLPVAMAGAVTGGRRRPLGIVTGFVVTLVVFTLALTEALEALGLAASDQRTVGVVLLGAFALTMIVPAFGDRLARMLSPVSRLGSRLPRGGDGFGGGVVMGLGLGLVWAPCAGPVFSAIAAANATGADGAGTWLVLFAYALGAALPMLAIMLGGRRLAARLAPRAVAVRAAMGVLLAATGVLIAAGLDTRFTAWAVGAVPSYTETLQAAERTGAATGALDDLQGRGPDASPVASGPRSAPSPDPERSPADLPPETRAAARLPVYAPAPELAGISDWFGADGVPRSLRGLRGKVVLLDFWTYSCINCIRTIPHLRALDRAYRDRGLVIIGVHTPEFAFEKDPDNVRDAIADLGVTWPVALDPDYRTWNAWGNRYWPAHYLIDRRGDVRGFVFGEGQYERTEDEVRALLGATGPRADEVADTAPDFHRGQTPESYLGYLRLDRFGSLPVARPNREADYRAPAALPPDHVAYAGRGTVRGEHVEAGDGFSIDLSFRARRVFLVLGGDGRPLTGQVLLDGRPIPASSAGEDVGPDGRLVVREHRLYRLADLGRPGAGRITIRLAPGTRAYAFTFG
jgi:cytochrome c biogenesis protein CcdA/thiol-disulfide isomerase/thioredoxin